MAQVPVLVVVEGPLTGHRFALTEGDGNTIGRAEDCTIIIQDPDMSRMPFGCKMRTHETAFSSTINGWFVCKSCVRGDWFAWEMDLMCSP